MAGGSSSGGTGLQLQQTLNSTTSVDLGDTSSDDGDQLYTPITDNTQLVRIAFPPILCDSFEDDVDASNPSDSVKPICFLTPPKETDTAMFGNSLTSSPASSISVSPPFLDPSMLCTTTLLDTEISLEDTSLDLYPTSVIQSPTPHASSAYELAKPSLIPRPVFHMDTQSLPSPRRKRAPSTQSPISSTHPGQKPKLARAYTSEFLPSTLGRSYCALFPPEHRLRTDFVHKYALDAELGAGGYGFVMTAQHRYDGREVAVKFIAKDKVPRYGWGVDDHGNDVPKEALLLSIVDHPGIVEFYDLFEDEVYFYLVQELHGTPWIKKKKKLTPGKQSSLEPSGTCLVNANVLPPVIPTAQAQHEKQPSLSDDPFSAQGNGNCQLSRPPKPGKGPLARPKNVRRASHDLFECIEQSKHKRFAEEDGKYVFAQVVDVVDYLDKLGITHCDIKDENVVIDKDLKIKIIDFGSVVSADPTQPRPFYRRFFGTAAYASPEILNDKPYQAPAAEVWALGVLLSFLITGTSPFPTEDDKRHGRIVLDEANAGRMSNACMHLLRRCLEANSERRASIAEVKSHPWLVDAFEREYDT
ncbi:kinase-like domain-containing protein [Phellopilus nigrolimitatus]|nr:kinase-like domain-containing protein [Phellopilus nigrolimitatus]